VLTVSVSPGTQLLGTAGATDGVVWFRPRFPVAPGVPHVVTFAPPGGPPVTATITVPHPEAARTRLTAVYPTADVVPENLLKFYLQFSAPVRRGEVYRRIGLLGLDGKPVDLPFLELDEELWDPTGTRLTLLIDPGRIKRGVKPREDLGPALVAGQRYTLTVDAGWPDGHGRPLEGRIRKAFSVTAAVNERVEPLGWEVTAQTGPAPTLEVLFPRPLDRALLERSLSVWDRGGRPVAGAGEVGPGETSWTFRAADPWTSDTVELRVGPDLEDLAGNRTDRVFDAAEPSDPGPPALTRIVRVRPEPR
jgi:hypothetical protein